jgi:hypothetical protein
MYEIPRRGATATPFRVQGKEVHSHMEDDDCPLATRAEYWDATASPAEWKEIRASPVAAVNMAAGARYADLTFDQEYFINHVQMGRGESYALDEEIIIPVRFITYDPANELARVEDSFTLIIKGSGEPLSVYCDYSQLVLATPRQGALAYTIPNPSPEPGTRVELDFASALTTDNTNISEMCMGLTTTSLDFNMPDGDIWTVWKEG